MSQFNLENKKLRTFATDWSICRDMNGVVEE